ncbi:hypothetical protein BDZ97DRAFT_1932535 [Flammula alnicola]|nr:hypothetical protein BDZ97DRAFT_1932535 [Flammula alnicola]
MSSSRHVYTKKALISECDMELEEFSERYVEKVRNIVFDGQQKWPTPEGSEIQQWFRRVAQGPNAVRSMSTNNRMNSRLISWKTGKKFVPENLFFRTVDTSRLLPVALADFRIQWYALKDTWAWLEGRKKQAGLEPREAWQAMVLSGLMFQLVVMRNMHDYGCGDIPVVVTTWSSDQLDRALEYWTQLSTGEWSEEEQRNKFLEIDNSWCLHVQPCFTQADLLVRALLSDPEVGYVPRFIVFMSVDTKVKARALFMHPSFRPPQALVETFQLDAEEPIARNRIAASSISLSVVLWQRGANCSGRKVAQGGCPMQRVARSYIAAKLTRLKIGSRTNAYAKRALFENNNAL